MSFRAHPWEGDARVERLLPGPAGADVVLRVLDVLLREARDLAPVVRLVGKVHLNASYLIHSDEEGRFSCKSTENRQSKNKYLGKIKQIYKRGQHAEQKLLVYFVKIKRKN